ncbi:TrbG/VirB9 family P-type conjugative transfer protein [Hyphococcus sp.]|uniref:TrbG/VirB9 family P-type conjugative transfer protein n=1 Tax=Hyphococcus sp. TaxID=2038636 RepID=UPI0035C74F59
MTRFLFILVVFVGVLSTAAQADSRIKTRSYAENRVYALTGHLGFQTVIEFNDDETIENVAIGDSVAWQVTPNRRGDVMILKPIAEAPPTNMTVVTSLRHYIFELRVKKAAEAKPGEMVFVLRFSYPGEQQAQEALQAQEASLIAAPPSPEERAVNRHYTYEGDREILPAQVFDDGRATYFRWAEGMPAPAIFLVDEDEKESVINHGFEDGFVVVDRVARVFSLKHGGYETLIYNDGYTPIDPGPEAPLAREKKRGFFGRVFGGDADDDNGEAG